MGSMDGGKAFLGILLMLPDLKNKYLAKKKKFTFRNQSVCFWCLVWFLLPSFHHCVAFDMVLIVRHSWQM